jgi:hypothetical protein
MILMIKKSNNQNENLNILQNTCITVLHKTCQTRSLVKVYLVPQKDKLELRSMSMCVYMCVCNFYLCLIVSNFMHSYIVVC